jgi:hypothetical protein
VKDRPDERAGGRGTRRDAGVGDGLPTAPDSVETVAQPPGDAVDAVVAFVDDLVLDVPSGTTDDGDDVTP